MIRRKVRVVELDDLPPAEPNTQDVVTVSVDSRTWIIYCINPNLELPQQGHVLIQLHDCWTFIGGGPNDEALLNHPAARYGLAHYSIQEIVNSPWIRDRLAMLHKDGHVSPADLSPFRHLVFAFKEGVFECLATGYTLVGIFPTRKQALQKAIDLSPAHEDDTPRG